MLTNILSMFMGGPLKTITNSLKEAYVEKLKAETSEQKLEAEKIIAHLEARRDVLMSEQQRALTSWIRPALAAPVVLYIWKLIVWDTILGWGVTPDPGSFVNWVVVTVIGAYMLTRPFERR